MLFLLSSCNPNKMIKKNEGHNKRQVNGGKLQNLDYVSELDVSSVVSTGKIFIFNTLGVWFGWNIVFRGLKTYQPNICLCIYLCDIF